MAESEEELKSLLMKVKEESEKVGLEQHSKNEDYGIWCHHFMANRWGNNGNSERLFYWASKSLQMVTAAMKLKKHLLLERKAMTNLESILKSKDITLLTKACIVQALVFPVVMYGVRIGP